MEQTAQAMETHFLPRLSLLETILRGLDIAVLSFFTSSLFKLFLTWLVHNASSSILESALLSFYFKFPFLLGTQEQWGSNEVGVRGRRGTVVLRHPMCCVVPPSPASGPTTWIPICGQPKGLVSCGVQLFWKYIFLEVKTPTALTLFLFDVSFMIVA